MCVFNRRNTICPFFTISLSQTPFLSLKALSSLLYSSVLFLSAFIKSASSLRKKLVFHSACEMWPWFYLDPRTAAKTVHVLCREHGGGRVLMCLWAVPMHETSQGVFMVLGSSEDAFPLSSVYWGEKRTACGTDKQTKANLADTF